MQALALSDIFLCKLGVPRENVDDAASAAQVFHLDVIFFNVLNLSCCLSQNISSFSVNLTEHLI